MKFTVKHINIDPNKIVRSRNFSKADQYMAQRVKAFCDPYVPMKSGHLKNSAEVGKNYVRYLGPYARFQYGGFVMVGIRSGSPWARRGEKKRLTSRPLQYSGGGQRGAKWDRRMMAERGAELRRDVENFVRNGGIS